MISCRLKWSVNLLTSGSSYHYFIFSQFTGGSRQEGRWINWNMKNKWPFSIFILALTEVGEYKLLSFSWRNIFLYFISRCCLYFGVHAIRLHFKPLMLFYLRYCARLLLSKGTLTFRASQRSLFMWHLGYSVIVTHRLIEWTIRQTFLRTWRLAFDNTVLKLGTGSFLRY